MSRRLTTPPPADDLPAMPQTPRWGYDDNYEPYPATRAAARQRANGNAVPATPRKVVSSAQGSKLAKPVFTGTAFSGGSSYTPPSTVAKKRTFKLSRLGDDLDFARDGSRSPTGFQSSSAMKSEMPSTPERTPRHKGLPKSNSNSSMNSLGSISRNLFSSRLDDDSMPSPRKHVKYGDVLGEVEEEEIHIFTDSKERIPEVDVSLKNPFYGPGRRIATAKSAETPAKARKGKKVDVKEKKEEEKQYSHSEGFWTVFRGKKIFKKFADLEDGDDDVFAGANMDDVFAAELDATVPDRLRGPVTRSRDLKPRVLFPTAAQIAAKKQKEKEQQQQITHTDEEADTDIEDVQVAAPTPKVVEKGLKTPRAAKIAAPLSPPTTARTTRSKDVRSDDLASASFTSTGSHSQEFQSWQSEKPQGKKRDATADIDAGIHKRIRSHAA